MSYPVREESGDPDDPRIEDVIDLAVERAASPRDDHPDAHLDDGIAEAVDRFGEDAVTECIRLTLTSHTNRGAGREAFGGDDYVWGIHVSVAATAYLRELRESDEGQAT